MQISNWKNTLLISTSLLSTVSALTSIPSINENILLLGDFNAISLYNENNTNSISNSTLNLYELSTTSSTFKNLNDSNLNSNNLPTLWQYIDNNSSVMIIDNKPYIYNFLNSSFHELNGWQNDNFKGTIKSIYYDNDDELIYFGGSLSFNNTFGAVQYDYQSDQLLSLPFGGFNENSSINSIVKYDYSNSILFGGDFNSIGFNDLLNITYNETIKNHTLIRNSTDLIDISQKISIDSNNVTATSGTNFKNIICPTNNDNGWILPDGQLGSWSASLQNSIIPSKIRLYNSQSDSNGVKYFRVFTYPANGIMNMTYIDPTDLTVKTCDAFCPLYLKSNIDSYFNDLNITDNQYYTFTNNNQTVLQLTNSYQDFSFVNSIDVESFTVQIVDFYGSYAELLGIELSRMGITVYADNTLNSQDSCSNSNSNKLDINVNSQSMGNLFWYLSPYGEYLYSNVSSDNINSSNGIEYNINIPVSGQYNILMFTPGCLLDNSCFYRGIVNVIVYDSDGKVLKTTTIYQTNEYEKYDTIFSGNLTLNSNDSPIKIEMSLYSPLQSSSFYAVAESIRLEYVQLELNEITGNITTEYNIEKSGILNLNGILEYQPLNFSSNDIEYPICNTSINQIGYSLNNESTINQFILNDTSLIIAGDFKSNYGNSIIGCDINPKSNLTDQIDINNFFSILGGTSNGNINQLYGPTEEFAIFGDFNSFENQTNSDNTNNLKNSVIYTSSNNSLSSLNIPDSTNVDYLTGFYFNDTEYLVISYQNNSNPPLLYDFTTNKLFENSTTLALNIVNALDSSNKNWEIDNDLLKSYVIGSIISFDLASNNIVSIDSNDFKSIPNNINNTIVSGIYMDNNTVAVAGSNIYLLDMENSKSIDESLLSKDLSFDDNTIIKSLIYYKDSLIFSTDGSGSFKDKPINGLAIYDNTNNNLKTINSSFTGYINDMTIDPQFGTIIAVGDYSVDKCNSICSFGNNSDSLTITRTVSDISGYISSINYYNAYHVLLGGNFTTKDENAYLGVYNTFNNTIENLSTMSSKLPGPVEKFVFGDNNQNNKTLNDMLLIMGKNYVGYFENGNWNSLDNGLDLSDSQLTDISMVDSNDTDFYNNQLLLLTGNFNINNYGTVSSALWNGKSWIPYTISAKNMNIEDAEVQSVVRMTTMSIYQGTFTSSPTSSSTGTHEPHSKNKSNLTNGQVTGVGFALALGTLFLFSLAGFAYMFFGGNKQEELKGLKLFGEDRVTNTEKAPIPIPNGGLNNAVPN